jgi:hypothetical protein
MGFGGFPWATIWEVVKAIGGIGLFAFAAAQLWLQRRERTDRRRTAFGIVYADFVRLMAKRADWDGADLVKMAASGTLYYEDIASPDWGVVASSLGGLSIGGLALFSHAYALLGQAADGARLLADHKGGPVGAMTAQELADRCLATLIEAVLTFEDAIAEIPKDVQALAITNPNPQSHAGKGFRQVYLERDREAREPKSGFWATLGRAAEPWI